MEQETLLSSVRFSIKYSHNALCFIRDAILQKLLISRDMRQQFLVDDKQYFQVSLSF